MTLFAVLSKFKRKRLGRKCAYKWECIKPLSQRDNEADYKRVHRALTSNEKSIKVSYILPVIVWRGDEQMEAFQIIWITFWLCWFGYKILINGFAQKFISFFFALSPSLVSQQYMPRKLWNKVNTTTKLDVLSHIKGRILTRSEEPLLATVICSFSFLCEFGGLGKQSIYFIY